MPVVLKKKAPEPSPHGFVQSAGKQEDFTDRGVELAAALGWGGDDPAMLGNDIAVGDARGFLVKVLHESFIAGAKVEDRPDPLAACEHLALTDAADLALVDAALLAAYTDGAGAEITHHPIVHANIGAAMTLKLSDEDAAKAAEKVG